MPRKSYYFFLLLLISVVNGIVTSYLSYSFIQDLKEAKEISFQLAINRANQISQKINQELMQMKTLVDQFAEDLTQGIVEPNQVKDRILNDIKNFPEIFGYGLAYASPPYTFFC